MKKLGDFKIFVWVVICTFFIVSCEKPNGETEFINTNEEESFMGTTGKNDSFIAEDQNEEDMVAFEEAK